MSSRPGGAIISTPTGVSAIAISISLSSSSPWRSFLRNTWRALESSVASSLPLARGTSMSSTRSSARSAARVCTLRISPSRCIFTALSTRSRMIDSTSRPTYPTSVNFVASTLIKGAWASFAKRRAISVLPTPVGPIIKIFFGVTSWRSASLRFMRRQRLRSAMATARFALA